MLKTTVIIPAFNEESRIGETLNALPGDLVEPIVVVNGSTDKTADIAKNSGARVIELEQQGKLPAIQETWRRLGDKALEPTLILDADDRPIFPRAWAKGMLKTLMRDPENPTVVGGPVWFIEGGFAYDALRSLKTKVLAFNSRNWQPGMSRGQSGPNMGIHIRNNALLDELLALPHYWPGEDKAITDTVVKNGGNYYQPISPALTTTHPASVSFLPISERLRLGHAETTKRVVADYIERGAPGSLPYYTDDTLISKVPVSYGIAN